MTNRIYFLLLQSGRLNRIQLGFTPVKGTEDGIKFVYDAMKHNRTAKLDAVLIMLDVKGAFNNLSWKSILQALRNTGCPRNIFHLIRSYFNERKVVYSTPSLMKEHSYSMGYPQGSNSGPLYWLLVANSLLELDLSLNAIKLAYADNFVVLVTGPNAYLISRKTTLALRKIKKLGRVAQTPI